jgi:hypothetical protein
MRFDPLISLENFYQELKKYLKNYIKKLCRHYFKINPEATASYVYAYRDMWDEKSEI